MEKELPKGWIETNLDTIVFPKKGKKPLRLESVEFKNSVPYLDIHALEKGIYRQYADINSSNIMDEDMIASVWDGARSGWVSKGKFGAIGSTLAALKPIHVDINYVFFYLQSKFSLINTNPRGIGIPHVDPTLLWNLSVPLPPLPEQQRIVAKLDTLFGHLDALKTHLDRIPQLLKDFRQKVLTQAVTGKLTEEWREGKELENIRSLLSLPDFIEDDRNGWIQTTVSNISKTISGYAFESSCFVETGIPLIRMGNLYQDKLDLNRNPVYIPSNYDERIVEKYSAKAGSILLSLTGTKYKRDYGYAIMIPEHQGRLLVNQRILNLEPKINNYFFLYLLRSDLFRDQFFSFETGGVNQGNVGSKGVESIVLAIPSMEEQQEIVRRVESLFAKANQIEASYQKLKAKIEQLPQTLLAKAFRGELVEQLPTDGDARDLLEQIKRVKVGLEKGGKGKKLKVEDEVKMVAEPEVKYKKKI